MKVLIGSSMACALFLATVEMACGASGATPPSPSVYNWADRATGAVYKVERIGEVACSADDSKIEGLAPEGLLRIEERQGSRTTVLEVLRRGSSELQRAFSVDGETRTGEEAAAWQAEHLGAVLRRTGIGASARVANLRAGGGASQVLSEIQSLPSDSVKSLYGVELVSHGNLDSVELLAVLSKVSAAISSGYERAVFLGRSSRTFLGHPELVQPFFAQVDRVPSPFRSDLFAEIASDGALDNPAVRAEYEGAKRRMGDLEGPVKKTSQKVSGR